MFPQSDLQPGGVAVLDHAHLQEEEEGLQTRCEAELAAACTVPPLINDHHPPQPQPTVT